MTCFVVSQGITSLQQRFALKYEVINPAAKAPRGGVGGVQGGGDGGGCCAPSSWQLEAALHPELRWSQVSPRGGGG